MTEPENNIQVDSISHFELCVCQVAWHEDFNLRQPHVACFSWHYEVYNMLLWQVSCPDTEDVRLDATEFKAS